MIYLRGRDAELFRWGMAAAAAIMAMLSLFGLARGLTSRQTLILDSTALRIPQWGFGNSVLTIRYDAITGMHLMQIRNQHFLMIRYNRGKVSISRSMLPKKEDFDRVCTVLSERVATVRSSAPV